MDPSAVRRRPMAQVLDASRIGPVGLPASAEVAVTIGTLVLMLTAAFTRQGHEEFPGAALLVFSVLAWLPLVARTRWPLRVLVATVVIESLNLVLVPFVAPDLVTPIAIAAYQPVPVATMVASFTVATRAPRRTAWRAGGLAATVLLAVSLVARPIALLGTDIIMLLNLVVLATALGRLVANSRERPVRDARERAEHTRREVEGERLRIARELHDVLAHSLTLVNAQAAVAEYLLRTDPQAASEALRGVTVHTSRALDELRATVGLLRLDGDSSDAGTEEAGGLRPTPGLERLDDLLEGFRTAGSEIGLCVTGEVLYLPPRGDVAAYRIIQEALTNATKHAPGAPVRVTLDWGSGELTLRVSNDRAAGPSPGHRSPGTGHGLVGMRERALAAGGTLRTEPRPDGGFLVRATLPIGIIHAGADRQGTGEAPSKRRDEP